MIAARGGGAQQERTDEDADEGRVDEAPRPPKKTARLPQHGDGRGANSGFVVERRVEGECCFRLLKHGCAFSRWSWEQEAAGAAGVTTVYRRRRRTTEMPIVSLWRVGSP